MAHSATPKRRAKRSWSAEGDGDARGYLISGAFPIVSREGWMGKCEL